MYSYVVKHTLPLVRPFSVISTVKVVPLLHEDGLEEPSCRQRSLQFAHPFLILTIPSDSQPQVSDQRVLSFPDQNGQFQTSIQTAKWERNELRVTNKILYLLIHYLASILI
jgi:hypothetical protein